MSFFKSLFLAIIATILLTYFLGASFLEFFEIDVVSDTHFKDGILAPIQEVSVSALVALVLMILGVALVLSVFGSIFLVMMLVFGAVLMVMIGAFWPILLVGFVVWLMVRDNSKESYS